MKNIMYVIVGLIIGTAGTAYASLSRPDLEGADGRGWVSIDDGIKVKKFYDKDLKVWCYITNHNGYSGSAISCFK